MTSDDNDLPTVTLEGKQYRVPPVAFREASKILPLINSTFDMIRTNAFTEDALVRLATIVFYGLKREHKELTLDGILDMQAGLSEMVDAALVVCRQCGLKMKEPASGEAKGTQSPLT